MKLAIIDKIGLCYDGDTLSKQGLGGSETAVILISKHLQKIGFQVTVYNNCTGFTGGIDGTAAITVAGSITLAAGQTYTHTGTVTITGTGTLITAGKTFSGVTISNSGITVTLGDALDIGIRNISLVRGTFDTAGYSVTARGMGSGLWTLLNGAGSFWNFPRSSTNLTFNKDTADILLSNMSGTFEGADQAYNKLTFGGTTTSTVTITGSNTFTELASTNPVAHTITFPSTQTQTVGTWSVTGTSGNVVTVNSSFPPDRSTINLTNATSGINFLDVKDISITDPDKFYVGDNSTDSGNNLNVYFISEPVLGTGNMFMLF
jgi:hypothetical protein